MSQVINKFDVYLGTKVFIRLLLEGEDFFHDIRFRVTNNLGALNKEMKGLKLYIEKMREIKNARDEDEMSVVLRYVSPLQECYAFLLLSVLSKWACLLSNLARCS
jgi:hypothetical protein